MFLAMDSSQKVIKIKFGDTLRRIKTYVGANRKLELCMADLRKKIHDLFKLPADSEFILTYVDEHGDMITLSADDELEDALEQSMKFVMINVELSNNNKGVNYGVPCELSKSVLQQLLEELQLLLSKCSENEISKDVADAVIVKLGDFKLNTAQSYQMINLDSQTHSTMSEEDDSDNNNRGIPSDSSKSLPQQLWEAFTKKLLLIAKYLKDGISEVVASPVLAKLDNIIIEATSVIRLYLKMTQI